MPRPRRNPNALGPQQNPRNLGQNRNASMRGNNRTQGAFNPVQGGLGPGGGISGMVPQQGQCPAGQISRPGPDGRPTCMPDPRQRGSMPTGRPGGGPRQTPGQTGQVAPRQPGAGIPSGVKPPRNREGY